jgi:eukaryotic-like serine/threonine-protein kinase
MDLTAGQYIGPYEIVSPLGAGGMGEVYRARDSKLKRDVALKILPAHVSRDVERLARFEREAHVLASLNHPHIATIYGVNETDGVRALILELVEGPTLAERLGGGPMPVREALSAARQIAEALDAAHEKGIVHRDLKPANIKVTPDGIVKVLDFGIAKMRAPDEAAVGASTVTMVGTRAGTLLGTAAYMSPEQARGQAVDKRSDIWAFGCVLYEMLTGRAAFAGETVSDTLARVLEREPEWERLPASTAPSIRRLLRRCLAKDTKKRLRDIGDVTLELEEPPESSPSAGWTANVRTLRVALSSCVVFAVVTGVVGIWSLTRVPPTPPSDLVRFTIDLQSDEGLAWDAGQPRPVAISRDGRTIVYGTRRPDGNRIYVRRLDSIESMPIAGTEGGIGPFLSPDGEWIAFASGGFLRRVPIDGGPSVTIVAVQNFMGGSWGPDDTIVYTEWGSGLFKVPARGGTPQPLTSVDAARGELGHLVPHVLPAGNAVLFAVQSRSVAPRLDLVEITTGRRRPLFEGSDPHYVWSGQVVFIRSGSLHAVPFDVGRLEPTGTVTRISDTASIAAFPERGVLAVASDGTLVYQPAGEGPRRLVWIDRKGGSTQAIDGSQRFIHPRLSPDGTRVVVWLPQQAGGSELWIYDLVRRTRLRLSARGQVSRPIWSHDGKRITFQKDLSLYSMPADDSTGPELVLEPTAPASGLYPLAWSRDGRTLVYSRPARETNRDVFTLKFDGTAAPFLQTPRDERSAMLSPDGQWMVYAALEPGREEEVYVQRYPGPGERVVVSPGGGREPVWSPLGNEIFYRSIDGRRMMAVDVTTEPELRIGVPRLLFEGDYQTRPFFSNYDVTPDAKQFLMIEESAAPQSRLEVVLHSTDSLGRQEQ